MAKRAKVVDPEVVTSTEVALSSEDERGVSALVEAGQSVARFFTDLRRWTAEATAIETRAVQTLAEFRAMAKPMTADEDEALKRRVRQVVDGQQKDAETHHEVRKVFHRIHKAFTARANRALDPLAEAVQIGNQLHSQFVRDEQIRVARENEERRLAAERAQREAHQREIAALEERLIAAETAADGLSEREQAYVEAVMRGASPILAAKLAGYQEPAKQATRLAVSEKIVTAIAALRHAEDVKRAIDEVKSAPQAPATYEEAASAASTDGDRGTWSAEVLDVAALVEATIGGAYGIPRDILTVDRVKLNAYAREHRRLLERWPGVKVTCKTTITR